VTFGESQPKIDQEYGKRVMFSSQQPLTQTLNNIVIYAFSISHSFVTTLSVLLYTL